MCDVYGQACFNQIMVSKGLNMDLPLRVWVKKTIHGAEIHQPSGKEKVLSAAISKKKVMLTVFCDIKKKQKKHIAIDFFGRAATVVSSSWQLLR